MNTSIRSPRRAVEHEITKIKGELERKTAELCQQREWFHITLASISDAVIATDNHSRISFVNPLAEALTGWTYAEAAGQNLTTVFNTVDEETRQPASNPLVRLLAEPEIGSFNFDTVLISRDGRVISIEAKTTPVRDASGQITGAVIVFHHATDDRACITEQRLVHEFRDRLAAVVESSDDAIISKTLEGIITTWNKGAERIFGYTAQEVIGKSITVLIPPERVNEEPAILERLRRGERIDHYETIRQRKDGARLNISLTVSPVRDVDGRIVGASKIARDITGRVHAEAALRDAQGKLSRYAEDLERQVAERTVALRQTVGELEAFSYSISHDLRAPLRAMQSFAHMVAEECGAQITPQGRDYIRRISNAAERMDRLIRDVLTYSRVARGEIHPVSISLEILLREIIESDPELRSRADDIQLQGRFPPVLAHESTLTQCISNLMGNAVKFVPPGVSPRVQVWSEVMPDGKTLRLFFKDNGIGIDVGVQHKIFGIFERATTEYEGTGIGLAIVKKGIERIGGRVGVQSEPGQGSTFWLELPLAHQHGK